ncbi:MAG: hypothetical protein ABGZ35_33740, partial [Planctomycetaceae bacterium]
MHTEVTCLDSPTCLNGVALYTKTGTPKKRFNEDERRQIHDATPDDLKAFMNLFCPRGVTFVRTSGGAPSDWTTPKSRDCKTGDWKDACCTEKDVLRHLQAELFPGQLPVWTGPRSWDQTAFVCIDVDAHGETEDFHKRCDILQKTLYRLGITEDAWLVSNTPSGGKHYRFFLKYPVPCDGIRWLFQSVGIRHSPGQFEIYPNTSQGVRLPFGHIPGQTTKPGAWVDWIRRFQSGEIRKICWSSVERRAEKIETEIITRPVSPQKRTRAIKPSKTPLSVRPSQIESKPNPSRHIPPESLARYRSILMSDRRSVQQIQELEQLGICEPGTRAKATTMLAWNLVCVRRLSPDQATGHLNSWAYKTGNGISKDVTSDLRNKTSRVAEQNASIVAWVSSKNEGRKGNQRRTPSNTAVFTDEEIRLIANHFIRHPELQKIPRCLEFAFRVLEFAKSHGTPVKFGFKAYMSVDGIIRKWPKCSGNTYKPRRDALIESGLLSVEEKKRQTNDKSGRPIGYGVHVNVKTPSTPNYSLDDAVRETNALIKSDNQYAMVDANSRQRVTEAGVPACHRLRVDNTPDQSNGNAEQGPRQTQKLMTFEQYCRIKRRNSRVISRWMSSQPFKHLMALEQQYRKQQYPKQQLPKTRSSNESEIRVTKSAKEQPKNIAEQSLHRPPILMSFERYLQLKRKKSRNFNGWMSSQPVDHRVALEQQYCEYERNRERSMNESRERWKQQQHAKRHSNTASQSTMGQGSGLTESLQSPARHG